MRRECVRIECVCVVAVCSKKEFSHTHTMQYYYILILKSVESLFTEAIEKNGTKMENSAMIVTL